ncbi:Beta-1,3-galactosyltransferase brn [Schistosoma japonicum]|uniref:Hexosyltransferase n=1 Tax=Schistosoma japonicum TaxID=6182 RepID=A0A4Z2DPA8_SCHJA|nr:Beta-1,3-galactosyltransferase 5 [Schistosoma japonicum]TNN18353.1 Beta-1,3-galactosyltransferase brn [Schistosoma japonicum]
MTVLIRTVYGIYTCKKWSIIFISIVLFFQFILLYNYITNNSLVQEHLKEDILYRMNMLLKCTESKQMWLQCTEQFNNLNITNYKTLRVFDSSVRLFHTSFTGELLDIQIPFKINNNHHMNDEFNERYILSNSNYVTRMHDRKSNVILRRRTVHHPKYFDVKKALHAIEVGLPADAMPINGGPIIVVQLPATTCNPNKPSEKLDLIVIVKSCIYCFDRRSYSRQTYMKSKLWKDFRIRFVFVVGLPTPNETDVYHFVGVDVNLHRNALRNSRVYESSRWIAAKKLYNESQTYNDMLIGSFYDTYFNLTSKMILSYRWAAIFCKGQTPMYLFIDDDYVLLPRNTVNLIKSLNSLSKSTSIVGGPMHPSRLVARPSKRRFNLKWEVSMKEYPWDYYPPYFYGIGYLMSSDVINEASLAMAFTQNIRIDDSYLGIVLSRLNKTLINMKEFRYHVRKKHIRMGAIMVKMNLAMNIIDWRTGDIKRT